MNANVSSLLAGLVLTVATVPLHAQRVEAGVVVHSGPVAGHVIVRDGYSTYRRPVTRRVIVVERPRIVAVERVRGHRPARHWSRRGYHRDKASMNRRLRGLRRLPGLRLRRSRPRAARRWFPS